jgi:hypothetical protein
MTMFFVPDAPKADCPPTNDGIDAVISNEDHISMAAKTTGGEKGAPTKSPAWRDPPNRESGAVVSPINVTVRAPLGRAST